MRLAIIGLTLAAITVFGRDDSDAERGRNRSIVSRLQADCAVTVRQDKSWQSVTNRKQVGVRRIGYPSTEGLYYQHQGVMLFVLCAEKKNAFDYWSQKSLNNIAHDYSAFTLRGNEALDFQGAPALWYLYDGTRKDSGLHQNGYVMTVDRGRNGLIIALATNSSDESMYSPIFRAAIDLMQLH